jgi:hypothetical protein
MENNLGWGGFVVDGSVDESEIIKRHVEKDFQDFEICTLDVRIFKQWNIVTM